MFVRLLAVCLLPAVALAQPSVIRARDAAIDVAPLKTAQPGDVIPIELFEHTTVHIELDAKTQRAPDRVRWTGSIPGDPLSVAVLAINDDRLAAYISVDNDVYEIHGGPNGLHHIEQVDTALTPACTPVITPAFEPQGGVVAPAGDDPTRIDMLVVYSPAGRNAVGGTDAMIAYIDLCEGLTNIAMENSLTNAILRVVHTEEVNYNESFDLSTDLGRLRSKNDGFIDDVHDLRDAVGADTVQMLVDDDNQAGVAYLMSDVDPGFEDLAFAVSDVDYAASNLTFPHELGHNIGCCHHNDDPGCNGGGAYRFARGHRFIGDSGNDFRTVLAYSPGQRIPRYSNPDVLFDGVATGIAPGENKQAHNALAINGTRNTVAAFRDEVCGADFNGDGELSILDFVAFQNAFQNQDASADCNEDGAFSILDFVCFQSLFQTGCE